jgi:hypothetical protein
MFGFPCRPYFHDSEPRFCFQPCQVLSGELESIEMALLSDDYFEVSAIVDLWKSHVEQSCSQLKLVLTL